MSNLVKLFYKKHGRHPAGNVQDEVSAYAATEIERLQDEVERLQEYMTAQAELEAKNQFYIEELENERDQLKTEIAHLQIEVTNLRGLKPEIPPMPGEDWPRELPRYILRENGLRRPRSVPHKDGYWTPWYLANRIHEELERERKAAKTACENWGGMKQERDQLRAMCADLELKRECLYHVLMSLMDVLRVNTEDPDKLDFESAIAAHDAQVIKQFVRDYTDWQGIDWMLTDFMHKRVDELSQQAKEVQS